MDNSVFEGIGLSHAEIKVFLIILELGESKAGRIIEKSGLQSSSVYEAINKLISKGLLSYIKKSQVKYYKTPNPEVVLDYIELKKAEYLKILPELKARQRKIENYGVEFFKSFKGIKTIMSELVKDAKSKDIYRIFSVENPENYKIAREKVFRYTKKLFKEKKILVRGIFHEQNRSSSTKSSITQKKYLNFPMPPNTMILNDKIAIISWDEEPTGILIRSKSLANQYISFFDAMWKFAKK